MKVSKIIMSATACSALAVCSARAQVQNGNFASLSGGSPDVPTDWTLTRAAQGSDVGINVAVPFPIPGGGNAFSYGAVDDPNDFPASYDELSQNVPTTAGDNYTFDFWVSGNNSSYFRAYFGSTEALELDNHGAFGWTEYSYTEEATGPTTTLAFYGNNVPSWVSVTDVSLTDLGSASAPDGATTVGLLGGAFGALAFLRRRMA